MGIRNALTVITTLALAVPFFAGTALADHSRQRSRYQERMIDRGVDSGALTPSEVRILQREQARIRREQIRAARDGEISLAERFRLDRLQDNALRSIHRLSTNVWRGHDEDDAPRHHRRHQFRGWGRFKVYERYHGHQHHEWDSGRHRR